MGTTRSNARTSNGYPCRSATTGHQQGRYARIQSPGQRFERGPVLPKQPSKVDVLRSLQCYRCSGTSANGPQSGPCRALISAAIVTFRNQAISDFDSGMRTKADVRRPLGTFGARLSFPVKGITQIYYSSGIPSAAGAPHRHGCPSSRAIRSSRR